MDLGGYITVAVSTNIGIQTSDFWRLFIRILTYRRGFLRPGADSENRPSRARKGTFHPLLALVLSPLRGSRERSPRVRNFFLSLF